MNHTNYLLHNILEKHNPYYRDLNPSLQKEFRYRTKLFTKAIRFRGGNGFKITDEHITAVSGAYIQITFGLSKYFLIDFDVITIYEKAYKSTITGMYHKGDVNPQGAIAISWEDFVKGYETDEDNLNVGLHEMAHAWFFSISMNRFDEDSNTYDKLSKFIFLSEEEVVRLRNHKKSIFRKLIAILSVGLVAFVFAIISPPSSLWIAILAGAYIKDKHKQSYRFLLIFSIALASFIASYYQNTSVWFYCFYPLFHFLVFTRVYGLNN